MAEPPAPSRVITTFGARCLVERPGGAVVEAHVRRSAGRPVCGDRVTLEEGGDTPVITAIEDRRNVFPRANRRGEKQIIAANLDRVIVVIAPKPEPTRDLVNRYLVACESVAIDAALCINKADLLDENTRAPFQALATLYASLGYRVICCSTRGPPGLDALRELTSTGTHVLVGQSGVGKSSLADALLPNRELTVQALSRATGKGRHTTTRTTLYHLPGGGELMDSPGVWEYGIWTMSPREVAAGFREFAPFIATCRFADCTHTVEPGCAVAEAAATGEIDAGRLASYRRIVAAMEKTHP